MIKIQIKARYFGLVLFEYEKENNTIKDTLIEAVKRGVNLKEAYLRGADLRGANLNGANLIGADLNNANLKGAYLIGAYLIGADLIGADLNGANLKGAYLKGACLNNANLKGAYLRGANLIDADLRGAKEIPYVPYACPSDGAFIGWKKVCNYLIKLEIPEDAKRCSATSLKCRCDKAKVIKITNLDETREYDSVTNYDFEVLTYKVDEMVYPDSFDEDRWRECSNGIHFFINKQDAIDY